VAGNLDQLFTKTVLKLSAIFAIGLSKITNGVDRNLLNFGFDSACDSLRETGWTLSRAQEGQVQGYIRMVAAGMVVLLAVIGWLLV
jgi:hypothetical protein